MVGAPAGVAFVTTMLNTGNAALEVPLLTWMPMLG